MISLLYDKPSLFVKIKNCVFSSFQSSVWNLFVFQTERVIFMILFYCGRIFNHENQSVEEISRKKFDFLFNKIFKVGLKYPHNAWLCTPYNEMLCIPYLHR